MRKEDYLHTNQPQVVRRAVIQECLSLTWFFGAVLVEEFRSPVKCALKSIPLLKCVFFLCGARLEEFREFFRQLKVTSIGEVLICGRNASLKRGKLRMVGLVVYWRYFFLFHTCSVFIWSYWSWGHDWIFAWMSTLGLGNSEMLDKLCYFERFN